MDPPEVDFAREVRPLLARKCFACHGNDEETQEADLRLDIREEALRDRGGYAALVPGDPDESEMWMRIIDDIDPMPPEHAGEPLEDDEREVIRRWIEAGAEFEPHWAFQKPARLELPEGVESGPGAIDGFVNLALAKRDLSMSPPADDLTVYRRLCLDLTGLPPTEAATRAFAESREPKKFEAAVEDLLASPAYAERWAAVWLDLARYADSAGHGSDPLRTIWRYRDWVIEAFDKNMPFDDFTVHQLAGDLIEGADMNSRLATAFHRNTMTNTEGGTDDEEFRVLAVKDRVATTMQVWTGLTAGCAECHSHKYDPISHEEYYQLFDIFNQTADTDRGDEAPKIPTPTAAQALEAGRLAEAIAGVDGKIAGREAELKPGGEVESGLLDRIAGGFDVPSRPVELELGETESATPREDGSFLVKGSGMTSTRVATLDAAGATAIRLEALADPSLPKGGPGRNSASGNFVLTNLLVEDLPAAKTGLDQVRRIRIDLPGASRILSLAEVQLLDMGGDVVPVIGEATQSSTAYGGDARRAIDGDTNGDYEGDSVTHTDTESDPYWELILAETVDLSGIRIWTRTGGDLASRLHGYTVTLFGESLDGATEWESGPAPAFAESQVMGPGHPKPILLTVTSFTHEQKKFEARQSVNGTVSTRDGWAVGGKAGRDHAAVFQLASPAEGRLRVTMEHQWGADHVIGTFRLSTTTANPPPVVIDSELRGALAAAPGARSEADRKRVAAFIRDQDPVLADLKRKKDRIAAEQDALGIPKTPVMVELEGDARRQTHVLVRGNFMQKAAPVSAAIPAAFGALPSDMPPDRLALAHWLVSRDNPLTARVTVNRVWARLFGRGLVRSEGDFGSQGEVPTHPDLLDWLAVNFMESGWDHKDLLRTIVTSKAYRQSSSLSGPSRSGDPDAVWLSRFPRQRLEAEMVRDMALATSGLLSRKRFGPSVFPPQPAGLWKAAFNGQRNWAESMGEDRYRRGLYVFLRRTIPYPMLATFDAPSREICTVQRIATNTPLQAFVTLNDPVFVEASQALGRALALRTKPNPADGDSMPVAAVLDSAVWQVTSRPPSERQVEMLVALYGDALAHFTADPKAATEFATDPLGDLPAGLAAAEAAAWTLVASTVLNLDAALTKD